MIPKIGLGSPLGKTLPSALSPPPRVNSPFHSLLQEKLEASLPLERKVLEFLRKTVETALWETRPEETEFFPSLSLLLPLRPSPPFQMSHPPPTVIQPPLPEIEPGMSNNLPKEADFEPFIQEAGERYGVDPSLIKAVIQVESGGNPIAVSKAGARGLMQLMPQTAAELGVTNPFDPMENIMGGTRYLRQLLDRYRGDVKLALAAYNWGMGNLERQPQVMPKETKNFIARVESLYRNSTKT